MESSNDSQICYIPLKKVLSTTDFENPIPVLNFRNYFAPITAFEHAPFKNQWNDLFKNNVLVDVRNEIRNEYRPALIKSDYGYFISIQWLKSNNNFNFNRFTVNFRIDNLLPIIATDENGNYQLPRFLKNKLPDNISTWTTLEKDLYSQFKEFLDKKLELNDVFESIDQANPSRMLCCKILDKFGDWFLVKYEAGNASDTLKYETHWIHPKSGLIRVAGWSQLIGYPILATETYNKFSFNNLMENQSIKENYLTNPDLFPLEPNIENNFEIGNYLELLDPLWHKMVIVKVSQHLRFGFMVLEYFHFSDQESETRKIFQHVNSRLLFPIGYSFQNNIPLILNQEVIFCPKLLIKVKERVEKYAAAISCFPSIPNDNTQFSVGHLVETFNLIGKGVIAYAIITRIVDRLLSLKFISYDPLLEIWVEYQSYHLRPIGFTNLLDLNKHIESPIYLENVLSDDWERRFKKLQRQLN